MKAIQSLVLGNTVAATAKAAGVGRGTLHRWLASDPHFAACLNSIRAEMASAARLELESLAGDAVQAIRDILTDPQAPARVRADLAFQVLDAVFSSDPGPTTPEGAERKQRLDEVLKRTGLPNMNRMG
jgi:hypothetical protein